MAVAIRLARLGRTHKPYYRLVAIDDRCHREGRAAEVLGTYDPFLPEKNIQVDIERAHAWIENGARYSDAVAALLKHAGYELYTPEQIERRSAQKAKRKARRQSRAKKDGKTFVAASRRAVKRHAKKTKQARLAELQKELDAKAAAKAAAEAEAAPSESDTGAAAEG